MSDDERHFLQSIGQPQARFSVQQVAWALNFQPYEVLGLVALDILTPIGNPAGNSIKYFYADEVLTLARDRGFLKKATNAMYQARVQKNLNQKMREATNGSAGNHQTRRGIGPGGNGHHAS